MSDNLNIKLLKQHAAILEMALQTVNNVSKSITEEAAALDAELAPVQDATDALAACERAQERARFAEAKLSKAVADLLVVSRAPEAVVQTERERAEKARALVENLEASLKNLG